jgi:Putative zinc-binding metallo-peptidase
MQRTLRFYAIILTSFLFIVTNLENTSAVNQGIIEENLDHYAAHTYNAHTASADDEYARALDDSDIQLHSGSTYKSDSISTDRSLTHCKSLVYQTLNSLPDKHVNHLEDLTLYFSDGRRGLAGGSTLILRCTDVSDQELTSVLVHEMGHIVDTGLYTGNSRSGESEFKDGNIPVYKDDLSLRFYRINWENSENLKESAKKEDFVTGYAMSDPFEDFAETYNFYILHGAQFKEMAKENRQLQRKYLFMKYFIFRGQVFDNDPYTKIAYDMRSYDATMIDYDRNKFMQTT